MRLDLGGTVRCTDGVFGELADLVIDPTTRRLTHLVVEPHGRHDLARLVPVGLARAEDGDDCVIVLDGTLDAIGALEPVQESAYLRLGDFPVEDPAWDIGVREALALPYYTDPAGMGAIGPIDPDPHITVSYDRVPKGDVEVRRASAVSSSDGHHLGHVDGFMVDGAEHITHVVLEHGHLWGRREVTIPIGAVARVDNDRVVLSLSRDEVGELKSRRVKRRHA